MPTPFGYNFNSSYPWINPDIFKDNYFSEVFYPKYQRDLLLGNYTNPCINPTLEKHFIGLNNLEQKLIKCNILPTHKNIERYVKIAQNINTIYEKFYGKTSLQEIYNTSLWQAMQLPQTFHNPAVKNLAGWIPLCCGDPNQVKTFSSQLHESQVYWKECLNISLSNFSDKLPNESLVASKPIPPSYSIGTQNLQNALINQGIDTSSLNLKASNPLHPDQLAFQKKFSILTKGLSCQGLTSSSIPFATDTKYQISNFQRGMHDEECLSHFSKNSIMYPEGSDQRFGKDYLQGNLLGCEKGPGANLFYFLGSLKSKMDKIKKNLTHSCQIICNHIDPCKGDSFKYNTNGAEIILNNQEFADIPNTTKDFLKILSLADIQSRGMQGAIHSGFSREEVVQEAFSAVYHTGVTGQPNVYLQDWDKKLKNTLKGFGHGGFQLLNSAVSFGHSYLLHTHADALENILDEKQRIQFSQKIIETVTTSATHLDTNFQKKLKIDPTDPSYQSGLELAHAAFDLAAFCAAAKQVGKGIMSLGELSTSMAKKTPNLLNTALENFPVDSGNRILKFKVSKISEGSPNYMGNLQIQAYDKKFLQMDYLNGPSEIIRREASQILHCNAKIALKPYIKKIMPEIEVRQLIEKTGIPTFPWPKGIPEDFRVAISENGAGIIYMHPEHNHTSVRVMPGKPHSPWPYQQEPYVIFRKNGSTLDRLGKVVSKEAPEAHIPLNEFNFE